ncbi:MAG: TRAP transporter fused permease subunit [Chloroflexota bacterium]
MGEIKEYTVNQLAVKRGIDWSCAAVEAGESTLERFWSSKKWDYVKVISLILGTLAIAIPVFVIYRGYFGTFNSRVERSIMITLLLGFAFLKYPLRRKWSDRPGWLFSLDTLFVLLAMGVEAYTLYSEVVFRMSHIQISLFGQMIGTDAIAGWILVILLLEATRRTFGWILILVPITFIVYSLTADLWPGPLMGAKASASYLIGMIYSEQVGLFGTGIEVLLSMVFVFLLFGSFVVSTNVGAFFTSFANAIVGRFAGGPAKVAVVASAFFGTASGSAIANVATTGCITIPLMKSIGYKPAFAGAVESCASSGGYFTPPIMGAAAFLIAAFTNTPYLVVCLYAALPALLYYLAIFIQVHIRAKKTSLSGLPLDMIPSALQVLKEGAYLILPAVFLVVGLVMGYSITLVAIWGAAGVILVSFFSKHTRQKPREMLVMVERASSGTIGISLAMVVVGIIEGTAIVSGFGSRLSLLVEALSGGSLILGLVIAAFVLMIMGMGVNPMLVYYMGYIFILPALTKLGAIGMPVHIFMLIYGGLANITPPVAMAAYTAANIAQASPMRTGFEAVKLGFAAYIVPFLLVLQPALLFMGGTTALEAVVAIATATLGIACMAISFEGWLFRNANLWERLLIFGAGLLQVSPSIVLSTVGVAVAVGVALWLRFTAQKTQNTAQEKLA